MFLKKSSLFKVFKYIGIFLYMKIFKLIVLIFKREIKKNFFCTKGFLLEFALNNLYTVIFKGEIKKKIIFPSTLLKSPLWYRSHRNGRLVSGDVGVSYYTTV